MNDQPKPTGERTAKMVREIRNQCGSLQATAQDIAVARAINAALAAEKKRGDDAFELSLANAKLAKERLKQLAAEREKVQTLVDALTFYSNERKTRDEWQEHVQFDCGQLASDTLAKVGTYPLPDGRTK